MRTLIVIVAVSGLAIAAPEPQRIALTRVFPGPGQIGLFIAAADGSDERPLLTVRDADYDPGFDLPRPPRTPANRRRVTPV